MSRTVLRGGTVLDGTGGPAYAADVLVADGRIAEVGPSVDATGARVLDAGGAYVAPGFIDMHTHLDPSLFWDPGCDPMPQHGVTTVLIGNCSLGLVPMRPELVDEVSKLFCYIEDMPRETFALGIPWTWERYRRVPRRAEAGGMSVHAAPLLGHSVLRLYVMGADAWERAATDDERAPDRVGARRVGRRRRVRVLHVVLRRRRAEPSGAEPPRRRRRARRARRGAGSARARPRRVHPRPPGSRRRAAAASSSSSSCGRHGVVSTTNVLVASDSRPQYRGRDHGAHPQAARRRQRVLAPDVAAHHRLPHQLGDRRWCS